MSEDSLDQVHIQSQTSPIQMEDEKVVFPNKFGHSHSDPLARFLAALENWILIGLQGQYGH